MLMLLLASGCGGHAPAGAPVDTALAQAANAGQQSLAFGRPAQAVPQYQRAFNLALARDDSRAIGDCGYDLAVAQLAGNDAAAALATTLRTRAALRTRTAADFAELDLAQAAALHRLGDDAEADRLAAQAQATASDPATSARASYVRGLIASGRHDPQAVRAALAGFGQPRHPPPGWQADHDEIAARLDLLLGHNGQAAILAQEAADLHRIQLDYAGMAATLALAATATQRDGSLQQAAALYLRAGESAAARGDAASAVPWLRQAMLPGADLATRRTAQDTLARLSRMRNQEKSAR